MTTHTELKRLAKAYLVEELTLPVSPSIILSLLDEVERLKADLTSYMKIANAEANEADRLRHELRHAKAVIAPFGAVVTDYREAPYNHADPEDETGIPVKWGHLRAAAAFMEAQDD